MAEALFRTGDLHFLYDAAVLPDEGQQAHRRLAAKLLQAGEGEGKGETEVRVGHRVTRDGYQLRVGGRIDLLQYLDPQRHDGARLRVCEFKSTRSDAARLHAHWASVHWAQAGLYAAMLMHAEDAAALASADAGVDADADAAPPAGGSFDGVELALHYVSNCELWLLL